MSLILARGVFYFWAVNDSAPLLKKYVPARVPYYDASNLPTTDLSKSYEEFMF